MSELNKNKDLTPEESWKDVKVSEEVKEMPQSPATNMYDGIKSPIKEMPVGPGNDSDYAIKASKKEENEVYKALQDVHKQGQVVMNTAAEVLQSNSKFITLHDPEDPSIEWYFNKDMIQSIMPSKKEGYCVKLASGSKYTFTDLSDIVTLRNLLPPNVLSFPAGVSFDPGKLSDFYHKEEGKL